MVDIAGRGRSEEEWAGRPGAVRPIAPALVVVALASCTALLAWGAVSFDRVSISSLWGLLGIGAGLVLVRQAIVARSHRTMPGRDHAGPSTTVRRDGAIVHNDARRHRRFVPARRATTLHLGDGRMIAARIIDISIAGVAVEARITDRDFASVDRVGTRAAGPIRRTPNGAVFGFETLLDPQPFDASFVL